MGRTRQDWYGLFSEKEVGEELTSDHFGQADNQLPKYEGYTLPGESRRRRIGEAEGYFGEQVR